MCINGIILLHSRMTQHSKSTILQQKIFIVLKKYSIKLQKILIQNTCYFQVC